MLKILFITISAILAILVSAYKIFISKLKRTPKISLYVSFMTAVLLIYVIFAFWMSVSVNGIVSKIIAFSLALSPFILGRFAKYETEDLYSIIQILIVILGAFYFLIV